MSRKCEDEFNPWPSFVDIFSSVILVMLLFLLVLLVNLGYYAQFKFKVSYTGTITTDELIFNSTPSPLQIEEIVKKKEEQDQEQKKQTQNIQEMKQEIVRLKKIIEERTVKAIEKKEAELESGGVDVADVKDDDNDSKQVLVQSEEYFIITYKGNEIFLDNKIAKDLKAFIADVKKKYNNHKILITAADVQDQASATVAKQISLARSLGTRNLIRKFGYEKKDVRIDLLASTEVKEDINKQNGYLVIRIKR
ncbi:hypothetical protein [Arcobacter roscoffensis]|uniref:OmpA-like domain-containing protein n=1 Tax=Arcobacter roscoffensis TaxID=2961520 RepID=A0ABY5E9N6_9BACT|nr:hypothetical protein [Arcobacter roscoffensis]UTJ07803.1 hypothetical protein NJU99_06815 [Arcobacter roscoffensis]